MKTIVFLHGMASSARSAKAQFLAQQLDAHPEVDLAAIDLNPTPEDFEFMTISGMVSRLGDFLRDRRGAETSLIGSSLGALIGLNYAHRYGGISKMLLLAPLLAFSAGQWGSEELGRWQRDGRIWVPHYAFNRELPLRYDFYLDGLRYDSAVPPAAPTCIIHGRQDEVIPIGNSRAYAASYAGVRLIEVDSDHRLADQLPVIWEQARLFLLSQGDGGESV